MRKFENLINWFRDYIYLKSVLQYYDPPIINFDYSNVIKCTINWKSCFKKVFENSWNTICLEFWSDELICDLIWKTQNCKLHE